MTDNPEDNGLTINGLWATAWVMGIAAVGSLARLVTYAVNGAPVQTELFVWVFIGTITGAFSACCAVLVGVTSAEQRLSQRADTSRK